MKNEFKKVLFIINRFSGGSYSDLLAETITESCRQHHVEASLSFTESKGHATALALNAAEKNEYSCVVAVGGDGTVNEVANGLMHSRMPMAILPRGSGNGLARHLGIPMRTGAAVQYLFSSREIQMDTFTVNGKLSLNISGIGFDGHVANLFGNKTRRGLRGYAKLTVSEFVRFREFEATVHTDHGNEKRKAFIIAIANSSQYGNNARIAPAASVCDGVLHICFLKKVPPYRVDFLYAFFAGKIKSSSLCEIVESTRVRIEVERPVAWHIDGEACGSGQVFDIRLNPASLRMLVPAAALRY